MENVSNPIIIDQFYCDSPTVCKNQVKPLWNLCQIKWLNSPLLFPSFTSYFNQNPNNYTCSWVFLSDVSSEYKPDSLQEHQWDYKEWKGHEICLQWHSSLQQHSPKQRQLREERWHSRDLLQLCHRLWLWSCASFSWLPIFPWQRTYRYQCWSCRNRQRRNCSYWALTWLSIGLK